MNSQPPTPRPHTGQPPQTLQAGPGADQAPNPSPAAPATPGPLQLVERGLHRLAYKRALGNLLGATQQWAAAARATLDAAAKADPTGQFSDEEVDAAAVAIQETFRSVVADNPGFKALFLVAAEAPDASVPE